MFFKLGSLNAFSTFIQKFKNSREIIATLSSGLFTIRCSKGVFLCSTGISTSPLRACALASL